MRLKCQPFAEELAAISGSLISLAYTREFEEEADRAHWQRFTDFQDKHDSYKTPVHPKEMNEKMVKWIGDITRANGGNPENNADRASAVAGYVDIDRDPDTLNL